MARKSNHSGPKYANGNYKSYQKKYDASSLQIKKRTKLNKENRMVQHFLKKHLKTEHEKAEHDPITSFT